MSGRVLLVDDDAEMGAMLETRLGKRGYDVRTEASASPPAVPVLRSQPT